MHYEVKDVLGKLLEIAGVGTLIVSSQEPYPSSMYFGLLAGGLYVFGRGLSDRALSERIIRNGDLEKMLQRYTAESTTKLDVNGF